MPASEATPLDRVAERSARWLSDRTSRRSLLGRVGDRLLTALPPPPAPPADVWVPSAPPTVPNGTQTPPPTPAAPADAPPRPRWRTTAGRWFARDPKAPATPAPVHSDAAAMTSPPDLAPAHVASDPADPTVPPTPPPTPPATPNQAAPRSTSAPDLALPGTPAPHAAPDPAAPPADLPASGPASPAPPEPAAPPADPAAFGPASPAPPEPTAAPADPAASSPAPIAPPEPAAPSADPAPPGAPAPDAAPEPAAAPADLADSGSAAIAATELVTPPLDRTPGPTWLAAPESPLPAITPAADLEATDLAPTPSSVPPGPQAAPDPATHVVPEPAAQSVNPTVAQAPDRPATAPVAPAAPAATPQATFEPSAGAASAAEPEAPPEAPASESAPPTPTPTPASVSLAPLPPVPPPPPVRSASPVAVASATALAVSQARFPTADTVVVARADALVLAIAAPVASALDAPLLAVGEHGDIDAINAEIERLGATARYAVGIEFPGAAPIADAPTDDLGRLSLAAAEFVRARTGTVRAFAISDSDEGRRVAGIVGASAAVRRFPVMVGPDAAARGAKEGDRRAAVTYLVGAETIASAKGVPGGFPLPAPTVEATAARLAQLLKADRAVGPIEAVAHISADTDPLVAAALAACGGPVLFSLPDPPPARVFTPSAD